MEFKNKGAKEICLFFPDLEKRNIEVQNKIIEEFNVSRKYPILYNKNRCFMYLKTRSFKLKKYSVSVSKRTTSSNLNNGVIRFLLQN